LSSDLTNLYKCAEREISDLVERLELVTKVALSWESACAKESRRCEDAEARADEAERRSAIDQRQCDEMTAEAGRMGEFLVLSGYDITNLPNTTTVGKRPA